MRNEIIRIVNEITTILIAITKTPTNITTSQAAQDIDINKYQYFTEK